MKKNHIKLIALISLTTLLLAGCGNTATDTENSTPTESQTSETVESEAAEESIESEVAEPATEEVVESEVVESVVEETLESAENKFPTPEEKAAEIAAEIGLDEELQATLASDLQWAYGLMSGDEEEYNRVVSTIKEDYIRIMRDREKAAAESESNGDEVNLPEDRAWVDDLYNKLVAKDYEAVIDIITSAEITANAEPYAYYEYTYDSTGYKLVTSDGKYVGLILSHIEGGENVAFYSEAEDRDYGFMHTEAGDIVVSTWISTISGERDYRWFDGTTIHFSNGNSSELLKGDIYAVWEM